jgi:hypothetical protein
MKKITFLKILTLSGDILELSAICSIQMKDEKNFEKFVVQLKPFYFDYGFSSLSLLTLLTFTNLIF